MSDLQNITALVPISTFQLSSGPSFLGDDMEYTDYSMVNYSSQLCLLLVVSIVCFCLIMERLNGRLVQLP